MESREEIPMNEDGRIGNQLTYFEEPDIIFLKLRGEVTDDEGFEIVRRQRELAEGRERVFFLVDLSELDSLPARVRRAASESMRSFPLGGTVMYKAPIKALVIAKLVMTAMNMFKPERDRSPIEFTDNEAQARAWIEERRQMLLDAAA
jgi:hypothetical protein